MHFDEANEKVRLTLQRQQNVYQIRQDNELHEEKEDLERKRRELQSEVYRVKETEIKQREQMVLKEMSSKMEKYLEHNLVSFLIDGLNETVSTVPEDPIDFLVQI